MENKKINYQLRNEQVSDLLEIYELIRTAFETAPVKDGDEQDFAVNLRNSNSYIPELALVAETNSKLIGHIMLTHTNLLTPEGEIIDVLLLAPLSVLLEFRNQGVGGRLVEQASERARQMGYKAIFLCGDPAYYNRFGFQQTSLYGITSVQPIPKQYVLVKELQNGFLDSVDGKIECC